MFAEPQLLFGNLDELCSVSYHRETENLKMLPQAPVGSAVAFILTLLLFLLLCLLCLLLLLLTFLLFILMFLLPFLLHLLLPVPILSYFFDFSYQAFLYYFLRDCCSLFYCHYYVGYPFCCYCRHSYYTRSFSRATFSCSCSSICTPLITLSIVPSILSALVIPASTPTATCTNFLLSVSSTLVAVLLLLLLLSLSLLVVPNPFIPTHRFIPTATHPATTIILTTLLLLLLPLRSA